MSKKSEQMQSIYELHDPVKKTEFGDRVMTEIGMVKGLEIDETVNYMLVPIKKDNEEATAWNILALTKDCKVEVESFNTTHKQTPTNNENKLREN